MVKAGGLTISWLNDGSGVSNMRKHIWLNITISEKQGRLLGNMCIHTTMNVVIPHSIIRHRHPAIIKSCYWMLTQPKGGFSLLPSYNISVHYKKLRFLSWQLNHYIILYRHFIDEQNKEPLSKRLFGILVVIGQSLSFCFGAKFLSCYPFSDLWNYLPDIQSNNIFLSVRIEYSAIVIFLGAVAVTIL